MPTPLPSCTAAGCDRPGRVCAYVDRRGRHCGTSWCTAHAEVTGGRLFCRRHAGLARALGSAAPDSAPRPDVESRAPSLAAWVARDLDGHVRALLAAVATDAEMLVVDACVSERRDSHSGRWVRGWSLIAGQGVSLRVAIEVGEDDDDALVRIRVGPEVVLTATPPWIAWHRLRLRVPEPIDAAARATFMARAREAVSGEVVRTRSGPRPRRRLPEGSPPR